jgi:hypothetical protein
MPGGATGRNGALYTGRGPVCGTIMRGSGACGGAGAGGAAGLAPMVGGGVAARGDVTACGAETVCAAGAAGWATGGFGAVGAGGAAGVADCGGTGGAGTVKVGRGVEVGTTSLGGATGGGLGGLGSGVLTTGGGGGMAALVSNGGAAGVAAGACCLLMIAFSASPGLEIWERSILVLISSASVRPDRAARLEVGAGLALRRRARTFSASCSSRELEWLFFSVTPISGSTSRIDLLLTSSSLARSLIRILLIRPFVLRTAPLSLHINLTASALGSARPLAWCERVSLNFFPLACPQKEKTLPQLRANPLARQLRQLRQLPPPHWLPTRPSLRPLLLR